MRSTPSPVVRGGFMLYARQDDCEALSDTNGAFFHSIQLPRIWCDSEGSLAVSSECQDEIGGLLSGASMIYLILQC